MFLEFIFWKSGACSNSAPACAAGSVSLTCGQWRHHVTMLLVQLNSHAFKSRALPAHGACHVLWEEFLVQSRKCLFHVPESPEKEDIYNPIWKHLEILENILWGTGQPFEAALVTQGQFSNPRRGLPLCWSSNRTTSVRADEEVLQKESILVGFIIASLMTNTIKKGGNHKSVTKWLNFKTIWHSWCIQECFLKQK